MYGQNYMLNQVVVYIRSIKREMQIKVGGKEDGEMKIEVYY